MENLLYLYCFRAGDYIKIGISKNPQSRLYELRAGQVCMTAHPEYICRKDLYFEGQLLSSRMEEREFHRTFQDEKLPDKYGDPTEWYPANGKAHEAFCVKLKESACKFDVQSVIIQST